MKLDEKGGETIEGRAEVLWEKEPRMSLVGRAMIAVLVYLIAIYLVISIFVGITWPFWVF